jgi:hypothetical protein
VLLRITYLVLLVVLVVVHEESLGAILLLTVLPRVVDDKGELLVTLRLGSKFINLAGLDEDQVFTAYTTWVSLMYATEEDGRREVNLLPDLLVYLVT